MKKSQLKQVLKPLVKECVKEVMLEEGILSRIVSEVARGLGGVLSEHQQVQMPPQKTTSEAADRNPPARQQPSKLQEHKNKLMTAIGESSYNGVNLFEGTTPAPSEPSPSQPDNPLLNQSPEDPGVDINDLMGSVGTHWNAHMNDVK